ncbi:hypothetical protein GW796_07015 [archaeon]|nr:hypothetical protein [archaeon]
MQKILPFINIIKFNELTKNEVLQMFFTACSKNDLSLVEFLLTDTRIKNVDISSDNEKGLKCACIFGSIDVLKYLLKSPNLKIHANIHSNNDQAFKGATMMGKLHVLEFLIFDMNIKKTEHIINYLSKNKNKEIENMFNERTLNSQLNFDFYNNTQLSVNTNKNKLK